MTCKCCDNISIYMWRVKVFWLILWRNVCVTCEVFYDWFLCDVWKLCDWYCDDVFVWRVKAFAIDIVTLCLCDVWSFCDWSIVWCVKALRLILWRCFCVTCEGFVMWWYCDDVSECVRCEGFVKWWYCVDVFVWRMKDLCLIPVLWRCFCVRVKVLCNAWSSVTVFFFFGLILILVPEVQIAVQQVGICGSDVKYWKDGGIGHFVVTNPLLLGHEVSGVISKVGEGVDHLKIGKTRLVHVYMNTSFWWYSIAPLWVIDRVQNDNIFRHSRGQSRRGSSHHVPRVRVL